MKWLQSSFVIAHSRMWEAKEETGEDGQRPTLVNQVLMESSKPRNSVSNLKM